MEWLPDVIQDFITKYAHAPETTEIKEHVIAAKALEEAAQIAGGVSKLAEQMADAFMKTPDKLPFLKRMDAASDAFFKDFSKKYPKLSKVGGLFRFAFWTGGLYMAITGFMGWKNLSADKKAATILTTIAVFDQMIISIPEFLTKAALTGDIFKNIKQFLGKFEILKGLQRGVEAIDNSWVGSLAKNVGGFFDKARKAIVVEGTILSKVFRGLTTILKWLGAAIAVAFAALSIYQFIKDLQDGDIPVANKVFDAIIMGCDILMAVCTVIALFVTSVIIAIAAAVFAVLGVIFAIVQLFLPKPKSPIDKAWDDTLHPFIAALPDAPAGWTPGKLNFA
jgi:hypothetical protein